jgi:hypothetical protein
MRINFKFLKRIAILTAFLGMFGELQSQTVNDLSWILGSWVMKTEGLELTETWIQNSEILFTGKGIGLVGKDTVFQEEMQLSFRENGIFYIVKAYGQNNDGFVSFKLVNHGFNTFVFENMSHDFPNTIVYRKKDENSLDAWIEGKKNGIIKTDNFEFKKLN